MGKQNEQNQDNLTSLQALGVIIGILIVVGLLGLGIWRAAFVTFVDNYEYAFVYDRWNGQIEPLDRTGWIIRNPFRYSVHHIDIRPYQVTISANTRVLNAKLVRFNPAGLDTFLQWHGRGAGDKKDDLLEILKCYAFDTDEGRDCPFLVVMGTISTNNHAPQPVLAPETRGKP